MSNQDPIRVKVTFVDPSKRRVNKILYLLLAFFLGDFGIHKFYIGQTLKGVIYFLFSWSFIPGLLSFISAVRVLLFEHADTDGMVYL